jgi:D-amino-acid dehydrogenase
MTARAGNAVIVGGGLIGAASAYYLTQHGWQVTILDRSGFGMGCSHGNCGFVSPSHVLPLAVPGAVRKALWSMLKPNSPFRIRPRLSWSLWSWLYRFARRCNQHDMLAGGKAILALLASSRQLYGELIAAERMACEWETRGMLFVLRTAHGMAHFAEVDELLKQHFAVSAERIEGDALGEMEPALKPGLAGAYWYRGDAHLRPDRLMAEWKRVLLARGVAIREHTPMTAFRTEGSSARAVLTPHGEFPADAFVIATGAWTPLLQKELGTCIPIQPGKGYSITMARPARCPTYPLIFEEHRVAVTPMQSGYRLGSTMEFAGYDATLNRKRLELLRAGARLYLHEPEGTPITEEWYGWRPMTPDSVPIIDRSARLENVWLAAGHNMLGLSMSPGTGKLVAELMSYQEPHVDPFPYRMNRF